MSIKQLQKEIHKNNVEAGWWDAQEPTKARQIASAIALMHLELSYALEKIRKGGDIDLMEVFEKMDLCINKDVCDEHLIKLALMHSEISEATEYHLSGENDSHLTNRKGEEVELCDAVIRIADYAESKGYDLESGIAEKREYNKKRQDHSKEARSEKSGKQF